MRAFDHFSNSIEAADDLLTAYADLRVHRKLGARGKLDAVNIGLLALPRAAVVAAIAALDAYVHAVLYDRIPVILQQLSIPDELCELMWKSLPVKDAKTFRMALPVLASKDSLAMVFETVKTNKLNNFVYQKPDKVIGAYKLIGIPDIFKCVADLWQGPNTSATRLKEYLKEYAVRRDKITHEGDHESDGTPRLMQPAYARECHKFIVGLVIRMNDVVYPST